MRIAELNRQRVCILGFGREGRATLRALEAHAPQATITIADANPELEHAEYGIRNTEYNIIAGSHYLDQLDRFDIIIKSPGIPPSSKLEAYSSKLTNATQIFLDSIAGMGAITVGITGSKGKSTTTTLIFEMLKADGKDAFLVGNIGIPALDFLDEARPGTIFVMEMSSYQLMDLGVSPQIAVITAFFPEHLDYHGSLNAYKEAKAHITRFQTAQDTVFYNALFPQARAIAEESPGERIPFTPANAPLPLSQTKLLGEHNLGNMAGAFLVAQHLGVARDVCLQVLRTFPGLPHRLQRLGEHGGIEWVDDAISTTPESTIAALKALGNRVRTIILGGQDRGNDFTELARVIRASGIEHVILFPGSGPRIKRALEAASAPVTFHSASSMEEAVSIAKRATSNQPFDVAQDRQRANHQPAIVLLSTASPSYGMFKNFEEKGTRFQECILGSLATS